MSAFSSLGDDRIRFTVWTGIIERGVARGAVELIVQTRPRPLNGPQCPLFRQCNSARTTPARRGGPGRHSEASSLIGTGSG